MSVLEKNTIPWGHILQDMITSGNLEKKRIIDIFISVMRFTVLVYHYMIASLLTVSYFSDASTLQALSRSVAEDNIIRFIFVLRK